MEHHRSPVFGRCAQEPAFAVESQLLQVKDTRASSPTLCPNGASPARHFARPPGRARVLWTVPGAGNGRAVPTTGCSGGAARIGKSRPKMFPKGAPSRSLGRGCRVYRSTSLSGVAERVPASAAGADRAGHVVRWLKRCCRNAGRSTKSRINRALAGDKP